MIGVFLALDLFLFYVFWEAMLIPMYLLIGVWGGAAAHLRRGQVLPLHHGRQRADAGRDPLALLHAEGADRRADLRRSTPSTPCRCAPATQIWLFLAFALAFAIKVPMFPFHTWLPDAHVEAPTAGSVILAGVLLKMGTYGFLRFAIPLFPTALAAVHARGSWRSRVIGIIYGALVSMVQPDLKKLVAYSSVSHLGFVHARALRHEPAGHRGRADADAQPRRLDRGALPPRGRALRAPPHPADRRLRRAVEADARSSPPSSWS